MSKASTITYDHGDVMYHAIYNRAIDTGHTKSLCTNFITQSINVSNNSKNWQCPDNLSSNDNDYYAYSNGYILYLNVQANCWRSIQTDSKPGSQLSTGWATACWDQLEE